MGLFEGIDLSGLPDYAKKVVEGIEGAFDIGLEKIGKESETILEASKKTIKQGREAVELLISGQLDLEGATGIWRRGTEQLEDLARAEGQLVAAAAVSFLRKAGDFIISFVSGILGLG